MDISFSSTNPALESVFINPDQIITLDANFLIPPDRSRYTKKSLQFSFISTYMAQPNFLDIL